MGNYRILFACTIVLAGVMETLAQMQVDPRNTVPDTIFGCYRNSTAYNRFTRQPMHIDNLIAIIRKIEEKTFNQWDMRKMTKTLITRYQFDGIIFNPAAKESYQYNPKSEEAAKTEIVKSLLPGADVIPDGILDNDEKCALHWMLSHSMNATLRDEEMMYGMRQYPGAGYLRARRSIFSDESSEEQVVEDQHSASHENSKEETAKEKSAEVVKNIPAENLETAKIEFGTDEEFSWESNDKSKEKSPEVVKNIPAENPEAVKIEFGTDEEFNWESDDKSKEKSPEVVKNTPAKNPEALKIEFGTDEEFNWESDDKSNSQSKEVDVQSHEVSQTKTKKSRNPLSRAQQPLSKDSLESKSVEIVSEEKAEISQPKEKSAETESEPEKTNESPKKVLEKHSEDSVDSKPKSVENVVKPQSQPPSLQRSLNLPTDGDVDTDFVSATGGGSKFSRSTAATKTRQPVETGVVYTKWGSVSIARVLAGIAAGLEPLTMSVGTYSPTYSPPSGVFGSGTPFAGVNNNNNNFGAGNSNTNQFNPSWNNPPSKTTWGRRKKRQIGSISFETLENLYAVTVAGDIGQAAILNAKYQINGNPPRGMFNDTVCPREYIWDPVSTSTEDRFKDENSWSYLTEAEIKGGMDGFILGRKIRDWNPSNQLRLSELLEMYYSERGVTGDPSYRSCGRSGLFTNNIDSGKLREQSRSFAWLYNNRTSKIDFTSVDNNPNRFQSLVEDAHSKINAVTGSSNDPPCIRRESIASGTVDTDDNIKYIQPKTTIYAVIDQTATMDEILQQQRFLGQLVQELDVSPHGSRLGLIDGNSGQLIISPNFTDNGAILACNILGRQLPTRSSDNKPSVLAAMMTEIKRLRDHEENIDYNIGEGNGFTLLFLVQGKGLDEAQRPEIYRSVRDLDNEAGDLRVMYASSKISSNDLQQYVLDPERDFVAIRSSQDLATSADEFALEYTQKSHGRLFYPRCNAIHHPQEDEHKQGVHFFVTPDTIQYYKISSDYFYSAKSLRLRFSSDNGKTRICVARNEPFPNSRNAGQNGVECKETTGSYVSPGSATLDVEFAYNKPCGKNGKRSGCGPIYVSFTPTTYPNPGSGGLDCSNEGCRSSNQVKVTFTHWDMRCNSAYRMMISGPVALLAALSSLLMWNKFG